MSGYKNYIILVGLDEARAHQRGEKVGKREKAPNQPKDETSADWSRNKDGTPRRRKQEVSVEVKRQVAQEPGETREVAERFGYSISAVRGWRELLKRGLL